MRKQTLAIILIVVAGCKSYTDKMEAFRRDVELDCSLAEYQICDENGKNRLLTLEEEGRLCQLQGDWRGSSDKYKAAMDYVYGQSETKPQFSSDDILKDAIASTYGNEMMRDYQPCAFEQMMVHTLDAFNRLALGEWDNFGVDVRNLETWRNEAVVMIDKDNEELKKSGIEANMSAASAVFGKNAVNRSTDNIYSLYLICLYREAIGDRENAKKGYRDIWRIRRNAATVKDAISNLNEPVNADTGEVVMFLEEGFVPPRREYTVHEGKIITTIISSTPTYEAFDCMPYDDGALLVSENGVRIAKSKLLCDLAPLAARSLDEAMGGIIKRQIARTSVKAATQGVLSAVAIGAAVGAVAAGGSAGSASSYICIAGAATFGAMAMGIYNKASERADLRSWLLLPRQVQIARFKMKPGRHTLRLYKSGMHQDVQVDVKAGKISVVHCITAPNIMRSFSACLDKIK